ncbi:hypothetical protein K443DRAFT_122701 [Laccaria amethystina LaAM-08-1]|uniref:Unplaced genomic scaffold K443scaffold_85, whole genome shotgun sequence n=1 Tax=Laccaria amethystina LaAM-08-1 TaxID=1095629 RepID=A0A0C9XGF4_9AGAR|nr:hypothetical protein K443DRAFT_122701 [Laccaria amethystina LaAM-08-1]
MPFPVAVVLSIQIAPYTFGILKLPVFMLGLNALGSELRCTRPNVCLHLHAQESFPIGIWALDGAKGLKKLLPRQGVNGLTSNRAPKVRIPGVCGRIPYAIIKSCRSVGSSFLSAVLPPHPSLPSDFSLPLHAPHSTTSNNTNEQEAELLNYASRIIQSLRHEREAERKAHERTREMCGARMCALEARDLDRQIALLGETVEAFRRERDGLRKVVEGEARKELEEGGEGEEEEKSGLK